MAIWTATLIIIIAISTALLINVYSNYWTD